jgi:hypothetical protein
LGLKASPSKRLVPPDSRSGRPAGVTWRIFLAAVLLMLAVSACATPQTIPPQPACDGEAYYFPRGIFPEGYPASDAKRRLWYSASLARIREPSLSCGNREGEAYRLIWLHDFAHPVVIRITSRDRQVEAEAFQLSGTGKGDPGVSLYRVHKRLSTEDWGRLQTALRRSRFWFLPTSGNMYGHHGEQWIVEGRRRDAYHIVDRWSPPAGAYRDLGVVFFDLVHWQRPDSSRY